MQNLVHVLIRDDVGARALRLCLYRVDGAVETVDIGLTAPTRSVPHVARLVALKLEALAAMEDAGFGFEAIGLAVTRAEPMPARQIEFTAGTDEGDRAERCAALIDALRQRLGPSSVRRFAPVASHLPERAEILPPVGGDGGRLARTGSKRVRCLLLPRAEPAESHGARPRRSAAAFSLARRDLRRRRLARSRNASAPNGGARSPSPARGREREEARPAIITSSRIAPATASGSTAKAFTGAKRTPRAGSSKVCLRE